MQPFRDTVEVGSALGEWAARLRLLPGDSWRFRFRLGALNVLTLRGGRIAAITACLDPTIYDQVGLLCELPA
jgi:hypothetical protein